MKKVISLILAIAGLALLSQCVNTNEISGTGTLIGNPSAVVTGTLFYKGGSPAANVIVNIRKQNSLAVTPGSSTSALLHDTASIMSKDDGTFAFESGLDPGFYAIEAQSGNNSVFIDSIHISGPQSTPVALSPDTLRPAGAIKGVVKLAGNDIPTSTYVLAFGINRFAPVASDGSFVFYPLAQGNYDLRIISSLENYELLDTTNIDVVPSDTTEIGVLELPYNGIPVPENVVLSYDSMKQIVTIHWSVSPVGMAKSFNVYRREIESSAAFDQPINKTKITSDFFSDSNFIQDHHYVYYITTVDANESESMKSTGANIRIVSPFIQVVNPALDRLVSNNIDFVIDKQNNFWIADYHQNKVSKYNAGGDLLSEWVISAMSPDLENSEMAIDAHKNIFLKGAFGNNIQTYDSTGNLIRRVDDTTRDYLKISVEPDGHLYCLGSKYICKYNTDGTFNKSWKVKTPGSMEGILVNGGKVYCAGVDGKIVSPANLSIDKGIIEVFDTSGTLLSTITVRPSTFSRSMFVNALAVDSNGILYCSDIESGLIQLFNQNNEFVGQFRATKYLTSETVSEIAIMEDGTIVCKILSPSNTISFSYFRKN